MMNARKLLEKRIPTLLGLGFLVTGLGVGVFLLGNQTGSFFPKASPETTPKNLKITNITDTSFTVSFLTDTDTAATVRYGTEANRLSLQATDDREQLSGVTVRSASHHITVRSLTPSTKYYFVINSAGASYSNGEKPYEVSTGTRLGAAPEALTAYGSVLNSSGQPAGDAIVYLTLPGSSPLSALVKGSGSWAIPLSTSRTSDLKDYSRANASTVVSILAQGKQPTLTSTVNTTAADTQPVPAITLGVNQTASSNTSPTSSPTASPTAGTTQYDQLVPDQTAESKFSASQLSPATEGTLTENADGTTDIVILTPAGDGEVFTDSTPVITGTAPRNAVIDIKVESDPVYTGRVTAGADGRWSYTPTGNLTDGQHTVTVTYKDASGRTQVEKRTFLVQADTVGIRGTTSNPSFTSSPSATTTPRATPTPSPSPTPTASGSGKMIVEQEATGSGRKSVVASSSSLPVSGSTTNTFLALVAGSFCLTFGLFLSRRLAEENRV